LEDIPPATISFQLGRQLRSFPCRKIETIWSFNCSFQTSFFPKSNDSQFLLPSKHFEHPEPLLWSNIYISLQNKDAWKIHQHSHALVLFDCKSQNYTAEIFLTSELTVLLILIIQFSFYIFYLFILISWPCVILTLWLFAVFILFIFYFFHFLLCDGGIYILYFMLRSLGESCLSFYLFNDTFWPYCSFSFIKNVLDTILPLGYKI